MKAVRCSGTLSVERRKFRTLDQAQEHFPRLRLKALAHFLARHKICCAGVQREGWSILRVLSWQMVRAVKPHPCALEIFGKA